MLIAFSGKSDTGKARANNQDYIGLPPASAMEPWLFVLADGMGGASGGEVASRLAVETVVSAYNATRGKLAPSQALTKAVKAANLAIYRKAEAEKNLWGMGTTVVAALVGMDRLLAAHVGDSRLYILRQGALNQITRDHSLVQDEVDQGIITKEQAKTHQMKNVLTRAVGAKPEVEVDLNTMELQAGDVIMACSDGLHGPVGRREIEALLGEDKPVDSVCQELIDAANGAGGPDNVSAIVVRVEQTGAAGGKDTTVRQGAYDPGADTARRRIKAATRLRRGSPGRAPAGGWPGPGWPRPWGWRRCWRLFSGPGGTRPAL